MKVHQIDNDSVNRIIIDSISAALEIDVKLLSVSELKSYNWSYIAHVFVDAANKKKYVIKIPKINNRQTITDAFHNKENIGQSFKEFQCLERLYSNTEQNNKVTVVRPLCYLSDINGILLEKLRGDKLYELIKGNKLSVEEKSKLLSRIGSYLNHCHKVYGIYEKLVFFDQVNAVNGSGINFENKLTNHLVSIDRDQSVSHTTMLLGFEIRNIFYCIETDTITIHDLQEVQDRPVYEDIAQFVVSLDLINWGRLFPKRLPLNNCRSFIEGYFGGNEPNIDLLSYHIVKEYLRFYRNSENMLSIKYGNFARKVIVKFYHKRLLNRWLSSKYWIQLTV
jgi:hypothetical protein